MPAAVGVPCGVVWTAAAALYLYVNAKLQPPSSPPLRSCELPVSFMWGDKTFAKARTAGTNSTEAGQARAKAEANIALGLLEEEGD